MSDTTKRILDIAERTARQGGYNSFSFREIAAEIGIKSASVHYHFPTKEILGEALAERYTNRFLETLGAPDTDSPQEMLRRYVATYGKALKNDGLMCLCGMFGAEIDHLPDSVARKTRSFFERNMAWLEHVCVASGLGEKAAHQRAAHMIASLEGAMILARSMRDDTIFDAVAADLI